MILGPETRAISAARPSWAAPLNKLHMAGQQRLCHLPYRLLQVLRCAALNAHAKPVETVKPLQRNREIGESPRVEHESANLSKHGVLLTVEAE